MKEAPPYSITPEIVSLIERIGEAIGRMGASGEPPGPRLRRINRIRTIRGSLAIEGNTLSEEQVSTLLDGRPVIAPPREVQEARNAFRAYDRYPEWSPASETDLLDAHGVLMAALLDAPGRYRRGPVVVAGPGEVHHIGPPADRVPHLMADLLSWVGGTDEHPLIASSVFHYEFEFIHPFADGNGRMGRLWQTLILTRWKPLFADVPVESLIHASQRGYYEAIRDSSARGESTPFIAYMLGAILGALRTPQETPQESPQATPQESPQEEPQATPQVRRLLSVLDGEMSLQEILLALGLRDRKSLRQRYLSPALELGYLEMTRPDAPNDRNQMYRLTQRGRQAQPTGR